MPMKRWIREACFGRRRWQRLFERLHGVALAGLNIGVGSEVESSGEAVALAEIAARLLAEPAPAIFDVGANIGRYTRAVLERFGERARLYAFEPSPRAFEDLSRGLAGRKSVRCLPYGLGDTDGTFPLHTNQEGSILGSLYARQVDHTGVKFDRTESIEIRRLDRVCRDEGISHIHLLKLDTEGNELPILESSREMLASGAIDFIQFEFGGCNIDSRTYFRDLFHLLAPHFAIHRILKDGLAPVPEYHEKWEVFLPTNFLAVSRRRL